MGFSRCTLLVIILLGLAMVPTVLAQTTFTSQNPAVSSLTNGYVYPEKALEGTESLYFGLMMSFGGTLKSSGVIPGVQAALDFINNNKTRSGVLENYTLRFILYDSQCNRTNALDGLFSLLLQGNSSQQQRASEGGIVALVGSGCSIATEPTAEISHFYNLPQISCVSSAKELSDRTRFRSYFQLLPSDGKVAFSFLSIIEEYGWRRVAFIVQNEPEFMSTIQNLKVLLTELGEARNSTITTSERKFETGDTLLTELGDNPFDEDSRIFMLAMSSKPARNIICKAYHQMMLYPKYIFLTFGSYESHWWIPPDDEDVFHNCTPTQRVKVLQRSLAASHFQFFNNQSDTAFLRAITSTMNREEFLADYSSRLGIPPFYFTNDEYSQYCFDAVWSLTTAINRTIEDSRNAGEGFSIRSRIIKALSFTSFRGLSGSIDFDSNGIRIENSLKVIQYREVERGQGTESRQLVTVDIAEVSCTGVEGKSCSFQYINGESSSTVWPDPHGVPYDGVPEMRIITLHPALSVIFVSLSFAGIIFTLCCLVFNFVFRKRKVIRLTSPNLNYLIGIGVILVYISAAVSFVQPTTNSSITGRLCIVRLITLNLGFTISFAAILAKIGRIYIIFRHTTRKIAVKDWHLVVFVLVVNSFNAIVLFVYLIQEGVTIGYNAALEPNRERLSSIDGDLEKKTEYFHYKCPEETGRSVVIIILYSYVFLLEIIALWFAFQTRKVKVPGLNDSKSTAAIVYLCSIATVIVVVLLFGIGDYLYAYTLVYGVTILGSISALNGLTFIPKMISLYKNPTGEGILTGKDPTVGVNHFLSQPGGDDIAALKKRIKELEGKVDQTRDGTARLSCCDTGKELNKDTLPKSRNALSAIDPSPMEMVAADNI